MSDMKPEAKETIPDNLFSNAIFFLFFALATFWPFLHSGFCTTDDMTNVLDTYKCFLEPPNHKIAFISCLCMGLRSLASPVLVRCFGDIASVNLNELVAASHFQPKSFFHANSPDFSLH